MKKFKKVLSFFLTLIIVLSCLMITAYANEIDSGTPSETSIVEYSVDPGWKATIPAYVKAADQGQQDPSDYTVTIYDVLLGDRQKLVATIDYDGILEEENGIQLPYSLYDSDGKIEPEKKFGEIPAGDPDQEYTYTFGAALDEKPRYAGNYLGTVMFNISVEKDETVYTPEEIEADEHLIPIGKTVDEYVVAKFSDDYSTVTIFKNGEESDGLMKDWSAGEDYSSYSSPFVPKFKSDWDGDSFEDAFAEDSIGDKIEIVIINDGVENVGDWAFTLCVSLTKIVIGNDVETIGYSAFNTCTALENLVIGNNVKTIEEEAFSSCTALISVIIPDSVETIGVDAFGSCTALENLVIGNNVKTIEEHAFEACESLTEVVFPDSIETIGYSAFDHCMALKRVHIGSGAKTIGSGAFASTAVEEVTIESADVDISYNAFYHGDLKGGNITVYGYTGSTAEAFAQANGYTFISL